MTGKPLGSLRASGPPPQASAKGALTAASMAFFLVILAGTSLNVGLASLASDLKTGVAGLTWVVNGYALVFASLLLFAGSLADRLGARRVFFSGLTVFTLASIGCAVAPSLYSLIAAQALVGLGAALILPASLGLVSSVYPGPGERGRAIAIWASAGGIAIAGGPVIGGLLVSVAGWRAIFAANAAVGIATLTFATGRLPSILPAASRKRLDVAGQLTAVIALCALTLVVVEFRHNYIVSACAAVTALLAVAGFIAVGKTIEDPMLPLQLLKIPVVYRTTTIGLLVNFSYFGELFAVSLYVLTVRNYSSLWTGVALLPMTATVPLANLLTRRIVSLYGARGTMLLGTTMCGLAMFTLTVIRTGTPYPLLSVPLLFVGFGLGLVVPSMTAELLGAVKPDQRGLAAGVLSAARQIGAVLGVAWCGSAIGTGHFVNGLRVTLVIAGAALLTSAVLAARLPRL